MSVDYKSIEFRLHELLVRIQEMLILLNADKSLLTMIIDNKELIKSKKYNVAVMGEFKKGKSSLINALLGSNILPADVTPTTATINRITYGIVPTVVINYKNGNKEEIDISELNDYVTKLSPCGEMRASQINEAIIYCPTVICQNHVDIIDTPGLNDDERMTKITIDMLENVDGVIVAISARTPFSDTEAKFVCQLIKSSAINTILFTITFLDQLEEEEYNYEKLMESIKNRIYDKVLEQLEEDGEDEKIINKANRILQDIHIFGISAKLAIKSFVTNNSKLLKASRFEEFKTELLKIIIAKQVENATQKTVENIHCVLSQIDDQYQIGVQRILVELQGFQRYSSGIYQYCNSCKKAVNDLFVGTEDEFTGLLISTYNLKNVLVSKFIKRLSAIRNNTHDEIKSAIASETLECFQFVNEEFGSSIKNKLYQSLVLGSGEFDEFRKTVFVTNLLQLNLGNEREADLLPFVDSALLFSKNRITNIRFSWQAPTMPHVADLAKCNVIETIINAVDISINKYHEDLSACIDDIRKHWFQQVSSEADVIGNRIRQKEDDVRNQADANLRTYASNYQLLSQNAKDIEKKSDVILQEFYHSAVK